MPKANRYFEVGHHYHLTHRCHGRAFLFRFARDRNVYREMLRRRLRDYDVPLLGYNLTSNHVHLVVTALAERAISEMMDALEGDFAQYYNLRKKRSGAFWGGRFHATAIEAGGHLWRCLVYVEMNMVRAGVVAHPEAWGWCSYPELMGQRKRYRLINPEFLFDATGQDPATDEFRANYAEAIGQRIAAMELGREPEWTEALAVGSAGYIEQVASRLENRLRLDREPAPANAWILREDREAYALDALFGPGK